MTSFGNVGRIRSEAGLSSETVFVVVVVVEFFDHRLKMSVSDIDMYWY